MQVNIHDAKTHFSELLSRVNQGEEVIIAKSGIPMAKLIPFKTERPQREPGSAKGKITLSEDFNDPLPEDILTTFYQ